MTHADIGDNAHCGTRRSGQAADLSEAAHAHLKHRRLVAPVETEAHFGQADFVVEVALCGKGLVFLRQHRGHHFLGGRLADRAGQPYYGNIEFGTIIPRQRKERQTRIGHKKDPVGVRAVDGTAAHCRDRAFGQHIRYKIVRVKAFAPNGEKERTLSRLTAVYRNIGNVRVGIAAGFRAQRRRDFF